MIELYSWPTPNGRKISIMLEELKVPYTIYPIDIENKGQFSTKFSSISPTNKIPAIIDTEQKQSIFESGAILIYLATKYNKFILQKYYWETIRVANVSNVTSRTIIRTGASIFILSS